MFESKALSVIFFMVSYYVFCIALLYALAGAWRQSRQPSRDTRFADAADKRQVDGRNHGLPSPPHDAVVDNAGPRRSLQFHVAHR